MRLIAILLFFSISVYAQYYVSPDGDDNNVGSISQPLKTIKKAFDKIKVSGDTIFLREGIYDQSVSLEPPVSGSEDQYKYLIAYENEHPVIDFIGQAYSSSNRGLKLTRDYWKIKGIEIKNAGDNGIHISGHYNIVENCSLHHNKDTGLQISNGGSYNQIINCDSYLNYDPGTHGENADGFAPKLDIGLGNYFKNCRAYLNSDDGWDCYEGQNQIIIDSCWAFHNGYNIWGDSSFQGDGNGFKLGGNYITAFHIIRNSIAFDNVSKGFDQNHNTGGITVYNCTGWRNGTNFSFNENPTDSVHILKNNLSFQGSVNIASTSEMEKNSWNGFTVSANDFKSLDTSLATIARDENFKLLQTDFLRLASASSLINSGVDVGIPFLETAPDLGAFEFDGISTSAKNISAKTNEFNLNQNFPNPFNLSTQINYSINKLSDIEISIYDVLGRRIKILFDGEKSAGEYRTFWNGIDENGDVVNSGVYFIILKSSEYSISRKIVLLK